jgi:hypothetical protein
MRPALLLRLGRRAKPPPKPLRHERVSPRKGDGKGLHPTILFSKPIFAKYSPSQPDIFRSSFACSGKTPVHFSGYFSSCYARRYATFYFSPLLILRLHSQQLDSLPNQTRHLALRQQDVSVTRRHHRPQNAISSCTKHSLRRLRSSLRVVS